MDTGFRRHDAFTSYKCSMPLFEALVGVPFLTELAKTSTRFGRYYLPTMLLPADRKRSKTAMFEPSSGCGNGTPT